MAGKEYFMHSSFKSLESIKGMTQKRNNFKIYEKNKKIEQ